MARKNIKNTDDTDDINYINGIYGGETEEDEEDGENLKHIYNIYNMNNSVVNSENSETVDAVDAVEAVEQIGHIGSMGIISNFDNFDNIDNIYGGEIDIGLTAEQIITVGDCPSRYVPDPVAKYTGKFLRKTGNNLLVFGICAEKSRKIGYKAGDSAAISYVALRSLYSFNVKITDIREVMPEDKFDPHDIIHDSGDSKGIYGYDNYIFEVIPVTEPEKQQRREFFRMPLRVAVYYKQTSEYNVEHLTMTDLKFEHELAIEKKKDADEGLLEKEEGYEKLFTLDLSAGGFKCRNSEKIAVNTYLNCLLVIDGEALPAIGRVVGCKPDENNPYMYDVRVSFCKISDPVRDRVVKYIFYQQRQSQAKFLKRRF